MNDRMATQLGVIKTVCDMELRAPSADPRQMAAWLRKQADIIEGTGAALPDVVTLSPVKLNQPN
jgi:hypothetical protein